MAYSYVTYADQDGSVTDYAVSFPYIARSHVTAEVDGVSASFTWLNSATIRMDTAPTGDLVIRRTTPNSSPYVTFVNGSTHSAEKHNTQNLQLLYVAQEAYDALTSALASDGATFDANGQRITNVGDPSDDQDAATKNWVSTSMDSQVAQAEIHKDAAEAAQVAAEAAQSAAEDAADDALLYSGYDPADVEITGGSITGVGISGGTINGTNIGLTTPGELKVQNIAGDTTLPIKVDNDIYIRLASGYIQVGDYWDGNPGESNSNGYGMWIDRSNGKTYFGSETVSLFVNRSGSTDGIVQYIRRNGNNIGNISVTGSAASFNTSSDYRLKTNIEDLTGATEIILSIPFRSFEFINNPGEVHAGVIAHELQSIVPHAVTGEKDAVDEDGNPEHQSVDYSKLVPYLGAALQDAVSRIDELEQRLAVLEGA